LNSGELFGGILYLVLCGLLGGILYLVLCSLCKVEEFKTIIDQVKTLAKKR